MNTLPDHILEYIFALLDELSQLHLSHTSHRLLHVALQIETMKERAMRLEMSSVVTPHYTFRALLQRLIEWNDIPTSHQAIEEKVREIERIRRWRWERTHFPDERTGRLEATDRVVSLDEMVLDVSLSLSRGSPFYAILSLRYLQRLMITATSLGKRPSPFRRRFELTEGESSKLSATRAVRREVDAREFNLDDYILSEAGMMMMRDIEDDHDLSRGHEPPKVGHDPPKAAHESERSHDRLPDTTYWPRLLVALWDVIATTNEVDRNTLFNYYRRMLGAIACRV